LVGALGNAHGRHLHALAWARDERAVEPDQRPKSVSAEETYPRDLHDADALGREAVRLSDAVAARLRKEHLSGRTVTLKVRFGDFRTITRSSTLAAPVDTGPDLARAARALLEQVDGSAGIRLLGVGVSNLVEGGGGQLSFESEGWATAASAVDDIRARFGTAAVGPAALIDRGKLELRRRGDQQWGPDEGR
jgi:DNA polymerase-4